MSILTINAFPTTATINASYNEETITAIGSVAIEVDNGTVVSYEVVAEQCTTKTGTETVTADKTIEVILNYIGAVSVDTWVPSTGKASFPTHIAMLGKGGWREVSSIAERDAIPSARREAGMAVFVTSEAKLYILNEDLETWVEFKAGSSDGIRKTSSFDDFTPLYDGEIVEYVGEDTETEESGSSENYVNGYFYQCNYYHNYIDASRVIRSASGDLRVHVELEGEDGFLQSGLQTNTDYTFVRNRGFWDCTDPEGITILGNRAGLRIDSSIVNNNDTVILRVEELSGYTFDQKNVQPATQLVWGNIEGNLEDQEDLNTELTNLQDQIDSLSGRGRYLTLWDCSTGLAETNPPESPYEYRTGDYFIVGTVAASGGTNYRPDGTSYTTGTASTVVETEEVNIDDTYIYDGSTWHLQYNSQKTVSFANIAGQPTDNTNLATALDEKADVSSIGDATLTITKSGVAVGSFSANATEDVTLDVDTDILPTQTGNEGKFLKTDGSHASWQEVKPIVWVSYVDE